MVEVLRAEVMETKKHQALRTLCHHTKNLYNRATYLYKQAKGQGTYLTYYDMDKLLKHEQCYTLIPAHTAQHTLKLVVRNWQAFYNARKEFAKTASKFLGAPQPPKYKKPQGEMVAIITNQQASISGGNLSLPKKVGFTIKTRLSSLDKLREVRIVPRGVGYTKEIVYQKHLPKKVQKKRKNRGALDLGLTNFVTFVDNIGSRPIIVKDEGKGIKSITQYYLKKVKQLQEQYAQQQYKQLQKQNRLVYGPAYYRLKETWRRKVKECFHQLSRFLVNLWKERELHTIYVGYNPLWKQQLRLRKKTTQLFVIIPFHKLIKLLQYKAEEAGIKVELVDESYTSKCSFLDNEFSQKCSKYKGKRIQRGLFRSAQGQLINADVNAAYNILLKSDPQALPKRSVGGVGGYVMYPLRVSYPAMKL
ncbi:MAG: RNA-guided endonuclease InsQ/TnpB family protein [Candidatus Heimdallarchaeaceae archaeon]